jgi:UDP-glucose 4-epimerase
MARRAGPAGHHACAQQSVTMRVAVTGGAGYIGSVITEILLSSGHEVLVLDDLSKGHRDAVSPQAEFMEVGLSERGPVAAALKSYGIEAVIHMAAYSLVGESVTAPERYYANNVVAGLSLLDAMLEAKVNRLVFSSTAAVYGEPEQQPIDESAATVPTNTYGETKLAFERALGWYAGAHGLRSVSLRYFNAAGATATNAERHDPETHLIPLVLRVAAGALPHVTIFGDDYATRDGTCVRDYIHVEDLAHAHVLALLARTTTGCQVYNLGCGGAGHTVREVIEVATSVTGRPIPVRYASRRAGDPPILIASSARIQHDLGWQPRQDLRHMVSSAWQAMKRSWRGRAPRPHSQLHSTGRHRAQRG